MYVSSFSGYVYYDAAARSAQKISTRRVLKTINVSIQHVHQWIAQPFEELAQALIEHFSIFNCLAAMRGVDISKTILVSEDDRDESFCVSVEHHRRSLKILLDRALTCSKL